jgi:hypothetical protein
MVTASKSRIVGAIGGEVPTNGALEGIQTEEPFRVEVTIEGVAAFLFHRYNCESVDSKSKAKKGSKEKKTDDVESYVWRDESGELCIPGDHLRGSIVKAAKFQQDPRSPRKSAMDLFKAGVICLTELATTGRKDWDYMDIRRVVIQGNAVPRHRPALKPGWTATFILQVVLPEYIGTALLNQTIQAAGRLCAVGDHRPTYGRFHVISFKLLDD